MPKELNLNIELIKHLYIKEAKSLEFLGEMFKCSHETIASKLRKENIAIRRWGMPKGKKLSEESRRRMSNARKGMKRPPSFSVFMKEWHRRFD